MCEKKKYTDKIAIKMLENASEKFFLFTKLLFYIFSSTYMIFEIDDNFVTFLVRFSVFFSMD